MRERPILFSAPMVRALLAGTKTQTRRPMKAQPRVVPDWACSGVAGLEFDWGGGGASTYADRPETLAAYADDFAARCPFGRPGETLWCRETWALEDCGDDGLRLIWKADRAAVWVRADGSRIGVIYWLPSDYAPGRWRPSIHMPRWASRLTLEVTEVRVQRLQEISEEDATAEGIPSDAAGWARLGILPPVPVEKDGTARSAFRWLWDSINGERASWASNPWVWAVSFRVLS
jgi:hypothetical protein